MARHREIPAVLRGPRLIQPGAVLSAHPAVGSGAATIRKEGDDEENIYVVGSFVSRMVCLR